MNTITIFITEVDRERHTVVLAEYIIVGNCDIIITSMVDAASVGRYDGHFRGKNSNNEKR